MKYERLQLALQTAIAAQEFAQVCCSVLQCVAVCCGYIKSAHHRRRELVVLLVLFAACCSVLQSRTHTAIAVQDFAQLGLVRMAVCCSVPP